MRTSRRGAAAVPRQEAATAAARCRAWLRELKSGKSCADCGGSFPPEAMQWGHLPGSIKLGVISKGIGYRRPKLVFEELAKCELVCANCHAIRTYKRLSGAAFGV